jgi:hypothetical protein
MSFGMAQGNGKSGDTLVSWFGGKNCKGRVSRLCMTPFKHVLATQCIDVCMSSAVIYTGYSANPSMMICQRINKMSREVS